MKNLNENSPLVKYFKKELEGASKQRVPFITIGKVKRKMGASVKPVDFTLENGQTVTIFVRLEGDIVRVKLNGNDLVIRGDLDFDYKPAFREAVQQIGNKVLSGQRNFDKKRTKKKLNIPAGKSLPVNNAQKINLLTADIAEIDGRISEKQNRVNELKAQLEGIQTQ